MTCRACSRVANVCLLRTSHSSVEKNDSAAALSKHDPTRPIDCRIVNPAHNLVKSSEV